ncbi:MAG: Co2+/Mg2+ efflux protein ApaG [Phycisphaerales bacterium]
MATAPAKSDAQRSLGSEATTAGVRVKVTPTYLADRSDPEGVREDFGSARFVFGYRIRITNESDRTVQLLSRHWIIVDADGHRSDVNGEGVVGQQPVLAPGQSFEYSSICPLPTPWGTMEGTYRFREVPPPLTTSSSADPAPDRAGAADRRPAEFPVNVARFFLVSPFAASRE